MRLHLGAMGLVALGIVGSGTGAAHESHLPGDFRSLHAHNGRHGLGALVAAGGTLADGSLALEHRFGIGRAAGEAAAAAVGTGQARIQLVQPGVGFHIENLGSGSQHQSEYQSQTAQNSNRNQNIHFQLLLRKSSDRRSP